MKLIQDLDRLLADGESTEAQRQRPCLAAQRDTAALGYALLTGFGVVAAASLPTQNRDGTASG